MRNGWSLGTNASAGILLVLAITCLTGCATARKEGHASKSQAGATKAAAKPIAAADDPTEMLREALRHSQALQGYEIIFHRQERRGIFHKLSEWEDLKVYYRKEPTSIKMTWMDPQSEYQECVYVDGMNNGNVEVLPRKGLLGLPAGPMSVPPDLAVTLGKSLRPITQFGLAAMVNQTLTRAEEAKAAGGAKVTYEGIATVEKTAVKARHIVVSYPPGFGQSSKQDIYIDIETGYPAGSYLWLPSGELLAAYLYEAPKPVDLGDEVFVISRSATTHCEQTSK